MSDSEEEKEEYNNYLKMYSIFEEEDRNCECCGNTNDWCGDCTDYINFEGRDLYICHECIERYKDEIITDIGDTFLGEIFVDMSNLDKIQEIFKIKYDEFTREK